MRLQFLEKFHNCMARVHAASSRGAWACHLFTMSQYTNLSASLWCVWTDSTLADWLLLHYVILKAYLFRPFTELLGTPYYFTCYTYLIMKRFGWRSGCNEFYSRNVILRTVNMFENHLIYLYHTYAFSLQASKSHFVT